MENDDKIATTEQQAPGGPNPEMKSVLTEEYRKPAKKITGWLTFFLAAVLGLATVISLGIFVKDFSMESYMSMIAPFSWLGLTTDMLMIVGTTVLSVYAIYAFVNFKPNAVALGYMDLGLRIYNSIVLIIVSAVSHTPISTGAGNPVSVIMGAGIWITYLYSSKQVNDLFPKHERTLYKRDKVLLAVIVIPSIVYWLMLGAYLLLH